MTYQPVLPATGNLGWSFLSRTREAQQEAFNSSAAIERNTAYFRENIGAISSAEELVNDRRLLSVALGAFGLDDDINNTFYIQKVLQEGTLEDTAFANRLADKRYFEMAEAFAFDLTPPNTVLSDFADGIIDRYQTQQFEVAVGAQDQNMRLALGLDSGLQDLADKGLSDRAAWFTIMGTPPLRSVFESALGIPPQAAAIDIDKQLEIFQERSERDFGVSNPAEFTDPALQEDLIRRFLLRQDLAASSAISTGGSVALSLLQSQPPLF